MELSKIRELENRYRDYDENGTVYYFDIHYTTTNAQGENLKIHRGNGAEVLQAEIDGLIEKYNPITIIVRDYKGTSGNAKPINPPTTIKVRDEREMPYQTVIHHPVSQPKAEPVQEMGGFSGFGSINDFLSTQRDIMNKDLELRILSESNAKLTTDLATLREEHAQLDSQNAELEEELEKAFDEVERLRKFEPKGNFTIFGFNGVELASTILSNTALRLAKKNPDGLAGILGVEPDEIKKFLDGAEKQTAIDTEATAAPQEQLSPEQQAHLHVATRIFEYCQQLSSDKLRKVFEIFSFIELAEENLDKLIEFVQSNNQ